MIVRIRLEAADPAALDTHESALRGVLDLAADASRDYRNHRSPGLRRYLKSAGVRTAGQQPGTERSPLAVAEDHKRDRDQPDKLGRRCERPFERCGNLDRRLPVAVFELGDVRVRAAGGGSELAEAEATLPPQLAEAPRESPVGHRMVPQVRAGRGRRLSRAGPSQSTVPAEYPPTRSAGAAAFGRRVLRRAAATFTCRTASGVESFADELPGGCRIRDVLLVCDCRDLSLQRAAHAYEHGCALLGL